MQFYTVEIQASTADGQCWQTLTVETVSVDAASADDYAAFVGWNQNIAEGTDGWRVCVWHGSHADTSCEPAAMWVAGIDDRLESLQSARKMIGAVMGKRDQLIRELMHTSTPRQRIADAAGLRLARLYQIRDAVE